MKESCAKHYGPESTIVKSLTCSRETILGTHKALMNGLSREYGHPDWLAAQAETGERFLHQACKFTYQGWACPPPRQSFNDDIGETAVDEIVDSHHMCNGTKRGSKYSLKKEVASIAATRAWE